MLLSVRRLYILLVCTAILFLVGCQGAAGRASATDSPVTEAYTVTAVLPENTDTPSPTPTENPTHTPTPEPTPTITPTPFVCRQQTGHLVKANFTSAAMQTEEIRYTVYLPPCYAHYQEYRFPVLYLLHGWPMDELHWQKLGIVNIVDAWITQGLVGPLMVVMPGVSNPHGMYINSSGGDFSFEGMIVNELVPAIDEKYRTWQTSEGRAIGGISRGGVWALEIGFRHPDIFGKVGAHSPALSVNYPLPAYDPFRLVESIDGEQRIYLSAGTQDWARSSTITLRDLLQEQDLDVTYQVHEGAHVDDLWRLGLPDYLHFYIGNWPRLVEDLPPYQGSNFLDSHSGQGFD